jgi:hypothetical protein
MAGIVGASVNAVNAVDSKVAEIKYQNEIAATMQGSDSYLTSILQEHIPRDPAVVAKVDHLQAEADQANDNMWNDLGNTAGNLAIIAVSNVLVRRPEDGLDVYVVPAQAA